MQTTCFSTIQGGIIDRTAGVIKGVCVIAEGQAKGHGLIVDAVTREQILSLAKGFANGVKAKLRHKENGEHQNVITETCGTLKDFRMEGTKVLADFHVLKTLPIRETLFEMAETMPEQFGFSVVFSGQPEEKNGEKFARATELYSIDLADDPAACPTGLFSSACDFCGSPSCKGGHSEMEMQSMYESEKDESKRGKMSAYAEKQGKKLSKKHAMSAPTNEELATSIAEINKTLNTLVTKLSAAPEPQKVTQLSVMIGGKEETLTGEQIKLSLDTANKLASDAKAALETKNRADVISRMESEGRVAMNGTTNKAYTRVELEALPLEVLAFAAANSPRIPLEAKAIYKLESKPGTNGVDTSKLKGSAKTEAVWESKFGTLEEMRTKTSF
jgi:hypothetical protein